MRLLRRSREKKKGWKNSEDEGTENPGGMEAPQSAGTSEDGRSLDAGGCRPSAAAQVQGGAVTWWKSLYVRRAFVRSPGAAGRSPGREIIARREPVRTATARPMSVNISILGRLA